MCFWTHFDPPTTPDPTLGALLALVFAVAGLARLADRDGSRRAMIDFGLSAALATPLAPLSPLVEVALRAP
jgi:hypothetical protein